MRLAPMTIADPPELAQEPSNAELLERTALAATRLHAAVATPRRMGLAAKAGATSTCSAPSSRPYRRVKVHPFS